MGWEIANDNGKNLMTVPWYFASIGLGSKLPTCESPRS